METPLFVYRAQKRKISGSFDFTERNLHLRADKRRPFGVAKVLETQRNLSVNLLRVPSRFLRSLRKFLADGVHNPYHKKLTINRFNYNFITMKSRYSLDLLHSHSLWHKICGGVYMCSMLQTYKISHYPLRFSRTIRLCRD